MSVTKVAFVALSAFAASLLVACGEQASTDASKMVLKSVGPENIKAGQKFNVQPDGKNAIWLISKDVPKVAVPVLAGVELVGVNVRDNGTLVTALVPSKLTATPGSYPLFMLHKPTGKKSNEIRLIVK
jgi:hypothetical protein